MYCYCCTVTLSLSGGIYGNCNTLSALDQLFIVVKIVFMCISRGLGRDEVAN